MRVKHGLDHGPSTYGMEVVRTVYAGVSRGSRSSTYVEKPGRHAGAGKHLVIWRLTGKNLEYSLVKLTAFPFEACPFRPMPKGENVPLKCRRRREEGLTASDCSFCF